MPANLDTRLRNHIQLSDGRPAVPVLGSNRTVFCASGYTANIIFYPAIEIVPGSRELCILGASCLLGQVYRYVTAAETLGTFPPYTAAREQVGIVSYGPDTPTATAFKGGSVNAAGLGEAISLPYTAGVYEPPLLVRPGQRFVAACVGTATGNPYVLWCEVPD